MAPSRGDLERILERGLAGGDVFRETARSAARPAYVIVRRAGAPDFGPRPGFNDKAFPQCKLATPVKADARLPVA